MNSIPSHQLDAFMTVVQQGQFSKAAKIQGLTQSALSQRVLNLEELLETTLLIRHPHAVELTPAGTRLLQYCQQRGLLESEFLSDLKASDPDGLLAGTVRVGGYATVMRSLVLPTLARLRNQHPAVKGEFSTRELREIPSLLQRGTVDFILMDQEPKKRGLKSVLLGEEEYVMIAPKNAPSTFALLDNDEDDQISHRYLAELGKDSRKHERIFLDDVYGVMDGVALGLGRAVVPKHLVQQRKDLEIVNPKKSLKVPVYMITFEKNYHTRLEQTFMKEIAATARALFN